jgi:hypothetical protein
LGRWLDTEIESSARVFAPYPDLMSRRFVGIYFINRLPDYSSAPSDRWLFIEAAGREEWSMFRSGAFVCSSRSLLPTPGRL